MTSTVADDSMSGLSKNQRKKMRQLMNKGYTDEQFNLSKLKLYHWNLAAVMHYYEKDSFCHYFVIHGRCDYIEKGCYLEHDYCLYDLMQDRENDGLVLDLIEYFLLYNKYCQHSSELYRYYANLLSFKFDERLKITQSNGKVDDSLDTINNHYLTSLSINNNNAECYNDYATFLSSKNYNSENKNKSVTLSNYNQSKEYFLKAIELDEEDAIFYENMSELLCIKFEEFEESLYYSNKAMQLLPTNMIDADILYLQAFAMSNILNNSNFVQMWKDALTKYNLIIEKTDGTIHCSKGIIERRTYVLTKKLDIIKKLQSLGYTNNTTNNNVCCIDKCNVYDWKYDKIITFYQKDGICYDYCIHGTCNCAFSLGLEEKIDTTKESKKDKKKREEAERQAAQLYELKHQWCLDRLMSSDDAFNRYTYHDTIRSDTKIIENYDKANHLCNYLIGVESVNGNNENLLKLCRYYCKLWSNWPENNNQERIDGGNISKIGNYKKINKYFKKIIDLAANVVVVQNNDTVLDEQEEKKDHNAKNVQKSPKAGNRDDSRAKKMSQKRSKTFLVEIYGEYIKFLGKMMYDYETTNIYYQKAIEIDSTNSALCMEYIEFLTVKMKDKETANIYYQKQIENNPNDMVIFNKYITFLINKMDDLDTANIYYQTQIENNPNDMSLFKQYIRFLTDKMADKQSAKVHFAKKFESDPKNDEILSDYVNFLIKEMNDYKTPKIFYEKAIENYPTNIQHYIVYACYLMEKVDDYDTAKVYYRKLMQIRQKDSYLTQFRSYSEQLVEFLIKMAHKCMYKLGEFDEALIYLNEALQINPKHSDIKYWHGFALENINEFKGAWFMYSKSKRKETKRKMDELEDIIEDYLSSLMAALPSSSLNPKHDECETQNKCMLKLEIYKYDVNKCVKYFKQDAFCYDYCLNGQCSNEKECKLEHKWYLKDLIFNSESSNSMISLLLAKVLCEYFDIVVFNEKERNFIQCNDLFKTETELQEYKDKLVFYFVCILYKMLQLEQTTQLQHKFNKMHQLCGFLTKKCKKNFDNIQNNDEYLMELYFYYAKLLVFWPWDGYFELIDNINPYSLQYDLNTYRFDRASECYARAMQFASKLKCWQVYEAYNEYMSFLRTEMEDTQSVKQYLKQIIKLIIANATQTAETTEKEELKTDSKAMDANSGTTEQLHRRLSEYLGQLRDFCANSKDFEEFLECLNEVKKIDATNKEILYQQGCCLYKLKKYNLALPIFGELLGKNDHNYDKPVRNKMKELLPIVTKNIYTMIQNDYKLKLATRDVNKDKILRKCQFKLRLYEYNIDKCIKYYMEDPFCYEYCVNGKCNSLEECKLDHKWCLKDLTTRKNNNDSSNNELALALCEYFEFLTPEKEFKYQNGNFYLYAARAHRFNLNSFKKSRDYCLKAIELSGKNGTSSSDGMSLSLINNELGLLYKSKGKQNYKEAENYFNKAIKLDKLDKDENKKSSTHYYLNLIDLLYLKKDYQAADTYLNRLVKLAQTKEETLEIYLKLVDLFAQSAQSLINNAQKCVLICEKALELSNYKNGKALYWFVKSLAINEDKFVMKAMQKYEKELESMKFKCKDFDGGYIFDIPSHFDGIKFVSNIKENIAFEKIWYLWQAQHIKQFLERKWKIAASQANCDYVINFDEMEIKMKELKFDASKLANVSHKELKSVGIASKSARQLILRLFDKCCRKWTVL